MKRTMGVIVLMAAILAPTDIPAQEDPVRGMGTPIDEILRRTDDWDHTLGPTGRRLFADRIEKALGVRARCGYIHGVPDFGDPIELAFRDAEGAVEAFHERTTWQPSHLEVEWRLGPPAAEGARSAPDGSIRVIERKFITDDDVLVDRVRVANRTSSPIAIEAVARSGLTPLLDRSRSRQIHLDLSEAANLAPCTGRRLFTDQGAPPFAWIEGEKALYLPSDAVTEPAAAASGGACLGGAFGAAEGHLALWAGVVPDFDDNKTARAVSIRYARAGEFPASFQLIVDNVDARAVEFPSTGGWGPKAEHWSTVHVPVGELKPGLHKFGLRAEKADSTIKVDGVFLLPGPGPAPNLPGSGRFPSGMKEQIVYLPGSIDYDGVRYMLPEQGLDTKPLFVALKGGIAGDRANRFPLSIEIDAPGKEPAVSWCHLLCLVAGPRGFGAKPGSGGAKPSAGIVFRFDNGGEETIPFPSVGERLAQGAAGTGPAANARAVWRFVALPRIADPCVQLSYLPPPGRFIDKIVLRKHDDPSPSPEVPVLLAVTTEIPPPTGRRPLHLGHKAFCGLPVTLALTGSEFVPIRDDRRGRILLRSLQIEPGGTEEFTLVLATDIKRRNAMTKARDWCAEGDPLRRHLERYTRWFDEFVPLFDCADRKMEYAWYLSWYRARHNMLWPQAPPLTAPVFYESLRGLDGPQVTARSTPHILSEMRWLRDKRFAVGQLRAHLRTPIGDGLFSDVRIDREAEPYLPHAIPAAALGVYHVHNEEQYLKEVLDILARNVDATLSAADSDGDGLPALAGDDFPGSGVERPDFAACLFASCQAMAEGYALLGNREKERAFRTKAERIREAVLDLLWDAEEKSFFALRAETNRPLGVRDAGGFWPFAMGLCDGNGPHGAAFRFLAAPGELQKPFPRLLDALGKARRGAPEQAPAAAPFEVYLDRHTDLTVEQAGTGPFCSRYNDLLLRFVGGLVPRSSGVALFRPVVGSLDHFRFSRLRYHGRELEIVWVRPGTHNPYADRPEGFTIVIDNEVVANEASLRPVMVKL